MQVIKTPSKKNTKKTTKEGTTESTSAASTTSPVKKASKGELEKQIAELQGKLATHEKKEADGRINKDLAEVRKNFKEYVAKNNVEPQDCPKVLKQFFSKAYHL